MVQSYKAERNSIICDRYPNSSRTRAHNSSSSCSLLTGPGSTRVDGSPMLAGLPVSCRPAGAQCAASGNSSRFAPSPSIPPAPVSACVCCSCYPRLIAKYPWVILVIVFLVSSAALVSLIILDVWPDFRTSPVEAFKTIDTPLSRKYQQLERLQKKTLSHYFPEESVSYNFTRYRREAKSRRPIRFCDDNQGIPNNVWRLSRLIISGVKPSIDLLSLSALRQQCSLQRSLRHLKTFKSSCLSYKRRCCRLLSLPNLVAALNGRSSCQDIIAADVNRTRTLITTCLPVYRRESRVMCWHARPSLGSSNCHSLPPICKNHSAEIFRLLHIVLPQQQIDPSAAIVQRTLSLLPVYNRGHSLELYRALEVSEFLKHAHRPDIYVEGLDFGLSDLLVDTVLQKDTRWLALGGACIFILVWTFSGSLLVTLVSHLLMAFSLVLAYFLYTLVFHLTYFPFVNVMSAVLAIAIGADDVFIFTRVWTDAKGARRDATLARLVSDTMRHAGMSIFVTSLSTAAALFANACSNIVAVKCFAVYSGIVVLVNFVLILACIPATWVIVERRSLWPCRGPPMWLNKVEKAVFTRIFVRTLPLIVIRFRHVWAIIGFLLAVASVLVIFYKPGFSFPRGVKPVFFTGNHPSEMYSQQKNKFDFESEMMRRQGHVLTLVWGVLPSDRRDPFSGDSVTPITPDPNFNPETAEAQIFLRKLCDEIHTIPRALPNDVSSGQFVCPFSTVQQLSFATFADFVSCDNKSVPVTRQSGCCWKERPFPFTRQDFRRCLAKYSLESHGFNTNSALRFPLNSKTMAGDDPILAGLVIDVSVNVSSDAPYPEMRAWLAEVNAWWQRKISAAPAGLSKGFYTSNLRVYDLHRDIATALPITVSLSVFIAAAVCLLTSLNLILSLLALVSVLSILSTTVATFVLLGWNLDIIEAVIMALAVGLAVDYCLHYGVAYRVYKRPRSGSRQERTGSREERAKDALIAVSSPITAAAVTTALAGVGMLPTKLLVYRQMAVFLITLMAWAWFFSTFVFVSLLALMGPTGNCAQLSYPHFCLCGCSSCTLSERVDKTVYSEVDSSRLEALNVQDEGNTSFSNHMLNDDLASPSDILRTDVWVKRSVEKREERPLPDSYESLSNV